MYLLAHAAPFPRIPNVIDPLRINLSLRYIDFQNAFSHNIVPQNETCCAYFMSTYHNFSYNCFETSVLHLVHVRSSFMSLPGITFVSLDAHEKVNHEYCWQ